MTLRRGRRRAPRAFLHARASDAHIRIEATDGAETLCRLLRAAGAWAEADEDEDEDLDLDFEAAGAQAQAQAETSLHEVFGDGEETELDERWTEELRVMRQMSGEERSFFMAQGADARRELAEMLMEQRDHGSPEPLRFRVLRSALPPPLKAAVLAKLARHSELQSSGDFLKYQAWTEVLLSLPLGNILVPQLSEPRAVALARARDHLDRVVYGHAAAKASILERYFQWLAAPLAPQRPLALQGVPGNGKTTLVREGVAAIMSRPFVFVALGGSFDSSFLLGHSYTYEGSLPGRVMEGLVASRCMNPVFYFDELDKCSQSPRGDEIANVLVHLTDPSQNDCFHDRYAGSLDLDVSRSLMVFTYNDPGKVSPVLLDRLQVVRTDAFDSAAQAAILQRHLLPRVLQELGLPERRLTLDADAAASLTRRAGESGVRFLRGALERATTKVSLWLETGDASYLAPLKPSSLRRTEEGHALSGDVSCLVAEDARNAAPPGMYS